MTAKNVPRKIFLPVLFVLFAMVLSACYRADVTSELVIRSPEGTGIKTFTVKILKDDQVNPESPLGARVGNNSTFFPKGLEAVRDELQKQLPPGFTATLTEDDAANYIVVELQFANLAEYAEKMKELLGADEWQRQRLREIEWEIHEVRGGYNVLIKEESALLQSVFTKYFLPIYENPELFSKNSQGTDVEVSFGQTHAVGDSTIRIGDAVVSGKHVLRAAGFFADPDAGRHLPAPAPPEAPQGDPCADLASPFRDIECHWALREIAEWSGRQWIQGFEDGTFRPNEPITRAQFAALVNRSFGFTEKADISAFADVPANAWYADDIRIAVGTKYLQGNQGRVRPNDPIKREEAAAVIARILDLDLVVPERALAGRFNDFVAVSDWSVEELSAVVGNGLMNGYPDGSLRPGRLITRAEALRILDGALRQRDELPAVQSLNSAETKVNSGVELGGNSAFEWNFRTFRDFRRFPGMDIRTLTYPRIRKLDNGDLLMIFQEGTHSWDIYTMRSKNGGKTWEKPQPLVTSYFVPELNDYVCYATGELLQLQNGWLLATFSIRLNDGYPEGELDGIGVMISKDYGYTWSEPKTVYRGANWEPSLLQLPSGEVQLYFTSVAPHVEEHKKDPSRQLGHEVGLLRSFDNGETWEPAVTGPPWRAEVLSRVINNHGTFSDGMPVAIYLNEDKGIVYAVESLQRTDGVSIIWSDVETNWRYPPLQEGEEGPGPDRRWYPYPHFSSWAPYLRQMRSGETVLSFNTSEVPGASFYVAIGDENARNFGELSSPFPGQPGYWGSIEKKTEHTLLATIGSDLRAPYPGAQPDRRILLIEGQLNHTIVARKQAIEVDGSNADWLDDSVLFVGSDSQAQATIRVAYDDRSVHFLVERKDMDLRDTGQADTSDSVRILVSPDGAEIRSFHLTVDGIGGLAHESSEAAVSSVNVLGTVNDGRDIDRGYAAEASIPWEALGGKPADGRLQIGAALINNDDGAGIVTDVISQIDMNDPKTWFTVVLGN